MNYIMYIISILQLTTIYPLKYNYKTKKFEKSKFLQFYSVTLTIIILIIFLVCFYRFEIIYLDHHDNVNGYCLLLLFAITINMMLVMLHQQVFKMNELERMSNKMLSFYEIGNNRQVHRIWIGITIFEFILMPILVIVTNAFYFNQFVVEMQIEFMILIISSTWISKSTHVFILVHTLILKLMKDCQHQIRYYIDKNNTDLKNTKFISKIKVTLNRYINVCDLYKRFLKYYQLHIILLIYARTFNLSRKLYRIAHVIFNDPNSKITDHIKQMCDASVTCMGFIKMAFFLINVSHDIIDVNKNILKLLCKIQTQSKPHIKFVCIIFYY